MPDTSIATQRQATLLVIVVNGSAIQDVLAEKMPYTQTVELLRRCVSGHRDTAAETFVLVYTRNTLQGPGGLTLCAQLVHIVHHPIAFTAQYVHVRRISSSFTLARKVYAIRRRLGRASQGWARRFEALEDSHSNETQMSRLNGIYKDLTQQMDEDKILIAEAQEALA